jgi:hypothetical protein
MSSRFSLAQREPRRRFSSTPQLFGQ